MASSEVAEKRTPAARGHLTAQQLPQQQVEHDPLPCPRCDSTNTKFCYYNNYNFSQPRHFCKSCRRYWTHGGTLRDIPIGGGSRKTAKRSRTNCSTTTTTNISTSSSTSAAVVGSHSHSQPLLDPVFVALPSTNPTTTTTVGGCSHNNGGGSFTSLLSNARPGMLALGGFGLGLGLDDGFGLGRGHLWAFPHDVGFVNGGINTTAGGGDSNGGGNNVNGGGDTWQQENGVSGDCFASLPELAISTPGNGLK